MEGVETNIQGNCFLTTAHTEEDLENVIAAVKVVLLLEIAMPLVVICPSPFKSAKPKSDVRTTVPVPNTLISPLAV